MEENHGLDADTLDVFTISWDSYIRVILFVGRPRSEIL
jgi:hypothetical protein